MLGIDFGDVNHSACANQTRRQVRELETRITVGVDGLILGGWKGTRAADFQVARRLRGRKTSILVALIEDLLVEVARASRYTCLDDREDHFRAE